jgi:hypothetical protein
VKEERTKIPEQQVLKDHLVHKASKDQLKILMLEQLKGRKFFNDSSQKSVATCNSDEDLTGGGSEHFGGLTFSI